ncbi:putative zinc-binding metallopeptidase [Henriciella sp. AS95]|uniref:zinc-binding metallopeptidase family protein n=1 Tax=Henriciella sp. AS95 TaxID=3135782 RepID=UPI003180F6F8
MKIFTCPDCGGTLYFDNLVCNCGLEVAFDPEAETFVRAGDSCTNRARIGCNWQSAAGPASLCRACAMTKIVPDSLVETNLSLWALTEAAKRWVLVNLGQWGWLKASDTGPAPLFHLLSETTSYGHAPVTMGHDDGLITINVIEADPAERVARRERLSESYRTLAGHFRHELGHYVFLRLSEDETFLKQFRALFGDERADYGEALARHYDQGPPAGWADDHVTGYASSHPHEDWAETFAHLVHLTDMLDSYLAAGFSAPGLDGVSPDPYACKDPNKLISAAVSVGLGMNHVSRSMGQFDIYPFVISEKVRTKLAFIHEWVAKTGPLSGAKARPTLPGWLSSLTGRKPQKQNGPVN